MHTNMEKNVVCKFGKNFLSGTAPWNKINAMREENSTYAKMICKSATDWKSTPKMRFQPSLRILTNIIAIITFKTSKKTGHRLLWWRKGWFLWGKSAWAALGKQNELLQFSSFFWWTFWWMCSTTTQECWRCSTTTLCLARTSESANSGILPASILVPPGLCPRTRMDMREMALKIEKLERKGGMVLKICLCSCSALPILKFLAFALFWFSCPKKTF